MVKVAVLGAGHIGRAIYQMITDLTIADAFVIDTNVNNISKLRTGIHYHMNLGEDYDVLSSFLVTEGVTYVVNALPFFLNEKVASAARKANCSYIDFTEDDTSAEIVKNIYKGSDLSCAVKCGLAPGFINYVGIDLVKQMHKPSSLLISVGALPRMVSFDVNFPGNSYNLTWNVDGLVNEYLNPCTIKKNGKIIKEKPLNGMMTIILDGIKYEAAHTSGGIGSLVHELDNVPNIAYMSIRYPGHFKYIRQIVQENYGDFNKIKNSFVGKFPTTTDDVVVVYANLLGNNEEREFTRISYYNKFYGVDNLTAIQSTTAGSGAAILELMLDGKVKGIITHSSVGLDDFISTKSFEKYYSMNK